MILSTDENADDDSDISYFVSSTFEDLVEERNALQRDVFPRLSKLCEARGARFQPVDPSWGVATNVCAARR